MNLSEILAAAAAQAKTPELLPEAALARLREAEARYAEQLRGPRFNVGDVVTPTADSVITGAGQPHIVLETDTSAIPLFEGDPASTAFGIRLDMRVVCIHRGRFDAYWVESWNFVPWTAPSEPAP